MEASIVAKGGAKINAAIKLNAAISEYTLSLFILYAT